MFLLRLSWHLPEDDGILTENLSNTIMESAMDPQMQKFYRQYLQQFSHLTFPAGDLLKQEDVQKSLEAYFYNDENSANIPFPYQTRVLDRIINLIETAVKDPHEEGVSDCLYSRRARLAQSSKSKILEKSIVIYHAPTDLEAPTTPILIREAKNIIGSGPNVGLRTWEASLRLAHYIYKNPGIVHDRTVLELGAGTGLLSILCSLILGAKAVIATDGIEQILDSLRENIRLNHQSFESSKGPKPLVRKLAWEADNDLETAFKDDSGNEIVPDIILGADITYHPEACEALAQLLGKLLKRWKQSGPSQTNGDLTKDSNANGKMPEASPPDTSTKRDESESTHRTPQVLISAVERAPKTITDFFTLLRHEIGPSCNIEELDFKCPIDKQTGLFHSVAMRIRVFRITG